MYQAIVDVTKSNYFSGSEAGRRETWAIKFLEKICEQAQEVFQHERSYQTYDEMPLKPVPKEVKPFDPSEDMSPARAAKTLIGLAQEYGVPVYQDWNDKSVVAAMSFIKRSRDMSGGYTYCSRCDGLLHRGEDTNKITLAHNRGCEVAIVLGHRKLS